MTKLINNRIVKLTLLSLITIGLLTQTGIVKGLFKNSSTAYASGDLEIDWGFVTNKAIFMVTNFLPGDSKSHTVKVTNNAHTNRPIGLQSLKTSETGNLSEALTITIFRDGLSIFGPQKLSDFFNTTKSPDYLDFSLLNPDQSADYTLTVEFPSGATNEYKGKTVTFDLTIGIAFKLPAECQIEGRKYGNVIFGTERRDVLNGTNGNDIILGFENDDVISGSNGDDCIIGGPGNDILHGSNGNDVILGNEGNDRIDGSNGNDRIYGGSGNDIIDANNGDDFVDAGESDDKINGGNGNDIIYGGPGNDIIDGGNGDDRIYGESGNDTVDGSNGDDYIEGSDGNDILVGKNGNDILLGGPGNDKTDGGLGNDRCEAESKVSCEI